MLAPGHPADLAQFIDVRDLASWLAGACHAGRGGVLNLAGTPVPFGMLLWISSERLVAAGVDPGMGIPLWVAEPGYEAFNDVDSSRAVAAGLTYRPVIDTIRDMTRPPSIYGMQGGLAASGRTPAPGTGLPVPSASSKSPPEAVPVSDGECISTPRSGAAQALQGNN